MKPTPERSTCRASRSVRAARDGGAPDEPAAPFDFVEDDSRTVGFLDLPDLEVDSLIDAVLEGFSLLADDAVITAYCTGVDVHALSEICETNGVELVLSVPHEAGTTFVLKRSAP